MLQFANIIKKTIHNKCDYKNVTIMTYCDIAHYNYKTEHQSFNKPTQNDSCSIMLF